MARDNPGKWRHNRVFEDVDVAHEEQLSPTTFWDQVEGDRAYQIARKRAKATMEGYEAYLHQQELDRQQKAKPKGKR